MVNELLGIQHNIVKANRTDRKVQNFESCINEDILRAINKTMDKRKAYGIDKVTKDNYGQNLEKNLANLIKRMKSGSYRPNPTRQVYTKGKMRPLGISCYEDKLVENRKFLDSGRGTPQRNGASSILANIYLHYVLDNWFDVIVKRQCKGEYYLIRYCDDFVCCFQIRYKAKVFKKKLELAEEKTKILEFGRFARQNQKSRGERKPDTFDFLGFTFYCGMDGKKKFFRCRVKTCRKKFRSKIKAVKEWIKAHRAMPLEQIFKAVNAKLRGHYQ